MCEPSFIGASQPESFEEKCRRFFEGVGAFQEKIWEDPAARARFESEMEAWDAVLEDGAEEYEETDELP